jgi:hypothetical protein
MKDKCSKCGAETELHENGNQICVKCSEEIESARKRTATKATGDLGSHRLKRSALDRDINA